MAKKHLEIGYKIEKYYICTTSYLHKVNNALEMFANPEHCPYFIVFFPMHT